MAYSMDLTTKIYSKTGKGTRALSTKPKGLPTGALKVLPLIDSKTDAAAILAKLDKFSETDLLLILARLERDGYIRAIHEENWGLDEQNVGYQTAMVVEELSAEDFFRADEKHSAETDPATAQVREETERTAREAEQAHLKAESEKTARLEAERIARETAEREARAKEEIRRKAEETARLEAERQAKEARLRAEAEMAARLEAERIAREAEVRAQAEKAALLEAERLVREAAERKAREEAERQARMAEEARLKAEADARAEAEKIAQLEAERQAREAEEARLKAEAEARALAEKNARLEAERLAREEEESRLKAETERKVREEAEQQARIAEEARLKAEADARAEAEKIAQLEAERIAREAAERQAQEAEEARLKAEAEARALAEKAARSEAERQAREEEDARHKAEAERKVQEEAERQVRIEEEARLKAEADARAEAENTARLEAERIAREAKERESLEEKEARRKAEAERKAQEEAARQARIAEEARLKAEADESRRREKEEARARAEEKARQKSERKAQEQADRRTRKLGETIAKKRNAPASGKRLATIIKAVSVYLPATLILIIVALHFVNLAPLGSSIQKMASETLGEPVRFSGMHASLFPKPQLLLSDVTIGTNEDMKIASIRIVLAPSTLFDDRKSVDNLEIAETALATPELGRTQMWFRSSATSGKLNIARVSFKNVTLTIPELSPIPFDGRIELLPTGEFGPVELNSVDRSLSLQLQPENDAWKVTLDASSWQPPLSTWLKFDALHAEGYAEGREARFDKIEGRAYGGTFTAKGTIAWAGRPTVSGNFKMENFELMQALTAAGSTASIEGRFDIAASFTSASEDAGKLAEAAEISGRFTGIDGKIGGVDLSSAMLPTNREKSTRFDKLTGSLQFGNGIYRYRSLALEHQQFRAQGNLDIQDDQRISGNVSAQLNIPSRRMQASFGLGGTVGDVRIR